METSAAQKLIEIPSSVDQITLVEDFIEELRKQHDLGEEVYGNILVAVTEGVNNAILHGNASDAAKKVKVAAYLANPFRLAIRIVDQGPGFDFRKRVDPTDPENLLKESGRGVFVMEHLADELKFFGIGNEVELQFNI
jgi:serine/threonine-protein kinase RsbW